MSLDDLVRDYLIKKVRKKIKSKIPWYHILARRQVVRTFDGLMKKIAGCVDQQQILTNIEKVSIPELVVLLESYSHDSKLTSVISNHISSWDYERAKKLFEFYSNPEVKDLVLRYGPLFADGVEGVLVDGEARTWEFINLVKSQDRSEIAKTIVSGMADFIKYLCNDLRRTPVIREYIDIFNNLRSNAFKPSVYKEFNDEIQERLEDDEHFEGDVELGDKLKLKRVKGLSEAVCFEKDFLNQQTSETVLPLAVMLSELYYIYCSPLTEVMKSDHKAYEIKEKLKQQQPCTLNNLAIAYTIAENNLGLGMHEFYDNLKSALDRGFADKWAKTIVEGYKARKDESLRMVLQDVA